MTAIEQKQHIMHQHINNGQIPLKPNIIGLPITQHQKHILQQIHKQQHQRPPPTIKDQHIPPSSSQNILQTLSNESSLASPFHRMNSPLSSPSPIQLCNVPSIPGSSSNTAFSPLTSLITDQRKISNSFPTQDQLQLSHHHISAPSPILQRTQRGQLRANQLKQRSETKPTIKQRQKKFQLKAQSKSLHMTIPTVSTTNISITDVDNNNTIHIERPSSCPALTTDHTEDNTTDDLKKKHQMHFNSSSDIYKIANNDTMTTNVCTQQPIVMKRHSSTEQSLAIANAKLHHDYMRQQHHQHQQKQEQKHRRSRNSSYSNQLTVFNNYGTTYNHLHHPLNHHQLQHQQQMDYASRYSPRNRQQLGMTPATSAPTIIQHSQQNPRHSMNNSLGSVNSIPDIIPNFLTTKSNGNSGGLVLVQAPSSGHSISPNSGSVNHGMYRLPISLSPVTSASPIHLSHNVSASPPGDMSMKIVPLLTDIPSQNTLDDFRLQNTARKRSDELYYTTHDQMLPMHQQSSAPVMSANNMLSAVYEFSAMQSYAAYPEQPQHQQILHQMQQQPQRRVIHYPNNSIGSRYGFFGSNMDQFRDHPLRGPKSSPSRLITNLVQNNSTSPNNVHHLNGNGGGICPTVRQISQPMTIMQPQSSISPSHHTFPYTVHSQPAHHSANIIPNSYVQSTYIPHYTNTNNNTYANNTYQCILPTANNLSLVNNATTTSADVTYNDSDDDDEVQSRSNTYSGSAVQSSKRSKHRSKDHSREYGRVRGKDHHLNKHHMKKKRISYNTSTSTSDEYSYIKHRYRRHPNNQTSSQYTAYVSMSYTQDSDEDRTIHSRSSSTGTQTTPPVTSTLDSTSDAYSTYNYHHSFSPDKRYHKHMRRMKKGQSCDPSSSQSEIDFSLHQRKKHKRQKSNSRSKSTTSRNRNRRNSDTDSNRKNAMSTTSKYNKKRNETYHRSKRSRDNRHKTSQHIKLKQKHHHSNSNVSDNKNVIQDHIIKRIINNNMSGNEQSETTTATDYSYSSYRDSQSRPYESQKQRVQQYVNGDPYSSQLESPSHLLLFEEKEREKSSSTLMILRETLQKEVLFLGLTDKLLNRICSSMYKIVCSQGRYIIREGEIGDAYFIVEQGQFVIYSKEKSTDGKHAKILGYSNVGSAFGESSLLYSTPRGASLRATTDSVAWALDAKEFSTIRQRLARKKAKKCAKKVAFLRTTKLFKKYHPLDITDVAQAIKPILYRKNAEIITEGQPSTHFFIIHRGRCEGYRKSKNKKLVKVADFFHGEYFGEHGICKKVVRNMTVTATTDEVTCYVLNAHEFLKLLNNTARIMMTSANANGNTNNVKLKAGDIYTYNEPNMDGPVQNRIMCSLNEFFHHGVIGVGSFGQISLVENPHTNETYSLKKIRKNRVVSMNQQIHVRNERAILNSLDSSFCIRFYGTYQDKLHVYFLMEAILGGELFYLLKFNKFFPEKTARFYAACVVLAFEHIHKKNVIFRDLKPENLLITHNGYVKLVDYGFAKKRDDGCTLCGTPEYLAPEVIQCLNQSFTTDWWCLGIFIYEMIIGRPPFQDDPRIKMYEKIITAAVKFPEKPRISRTGKELIISLLRKHAYKRLGHGLNGTYDVKHHHWFSNFNWETMKKQDIEPPYIPKIRNNTDVSNFEYFPAEDIDEELIDDGDGIIFSWTEGF